jgi:Flp pilus assembly pilin Flp
MLALLTRLIRDDEGQDLIEYALLTAGIGLAGLAVWPAITAAVGVAYQILDANIQDLWEVPDPGAGGGS